MKDWNDEALMQAYQTGDLPAFEELYRRSSGRVYGYLKSRLARPEERDEVFQQIFLKLHRTRSQYSIEHSFSQWLFVISKSVFIDYLRKKRRSPADLGTAEINEIEKIHAPLSQNEGVQAYSKMEALASLTIEQQKVVGWRVLDELSYQEIASKLNRSETSVRQILSRALKKLRLQSDLKESK